MMQADSMDINVRKRMTALRERHCAHPRFNLDVRHACDQGDGIQGYGYHKHDGREYASQEINDKPSNIILNTEFIKVPGGNHGGDWGVRISGTTMDDFGNKC